VWSEVPATGLFCSRLTDGDESTCSDNSSMIQTITGYPWLRQSSDTSYDDRVIALSDCRELDSLTTTNLFPSSWKGVTVVVGKLAVRSNIVTINTQCPTDDSVSSVILDHSASQSTSLISANSCSEIESNSTNTFENSGEMKERRPTDSSHELYSYVNESHVEVADRLIDVLGEAVRIRVQSQSSMCSDCLRIHLERSTTDASLNEALPAANRDQYSVDSCTLDIGVRSDVNFRTRTEENICENISVNKMLISKMVKSDEDSDTSVAQGNSFLSAGACHHSRVAILYSGGIDSHVIAALADK